MVDRAGDPYCVGFVPGVTEVGRVDRLLALAHRAIVETIEEVGRALPRIPVLLATCEVEGPEAEPFAQRTARQLERMLAPLGEFDVAVVPQGNAGGYSVLQAAIAQIQTGRHQVCLVVGADSFIDADVLDELDFSSRLGCTRHRWGFPPGEAGAALLLASRSTAQSSQLRSLGEIVSVAVGHETAHARAEEPCTGAGLGRVLSEVLRASEGAGVAYTLCDLDGERYRDREYTWATQRVPPTIPFDASLYDTLAPSCGAVGGATAILHMATAVCWAQRGHHSDTNVLSWGGSVFGRRGAAIVRTGAPR